MPTSSEPKSSPSLDAIDNAPLATRGETDFDNEQSKFYAALVAELSEELENTQAELELLKAKRSVASVKAGMMRPYADKVYWFMLGYCAIVGAMLLLQAWKVCNFYLSDPVLTVLAGSTAAAAIGLVGFVVSGLFRSQAGDD